MELEYGHRIFGGEEEQKTLKLKCYSAYIRNLHTTERIEFELVKAKHHPSLGKPHVRAVVIAQSKILLMPLIGKHFLNIVVIHITDCGLREITKKDLQQFPSLRLLHLMNNSIESLPADLFEQTRLIEQISFRCNQIRFISRNTLEPLIHLKIADFRKNTTIDEFFYSIENSSGSITLLALKEKIVAQCTPPTERLSTVSSYVDKLFQGDFSDFKIKSKAEVFNVHKVILAANSSVFAAMFTHAMKETLENEMTITNFCPETIREFLSFVYLRQIPSKCFIATDLYAMAEEYQVEELSLRIQWIIVKEVNVENAAEMFKFGVLYRNELIKRNAFQGIETSLNKKLPPNLMDSNEDMAEMLEAKQKFDEILKRVIKTHL